MKYVILATTALLMAASPAALANGTVKSKQPVCPPKRHHHMHHHQHQVAACPAPCDPCPAIKSGFFFGAQAGWGFSFNKTKSSITFPGVVVDRTLDDRAHINANGPMGGIYFGYDHLFCNHVLLGLELGAKLSRFHGKDNASSDVFEARKLKTRDSYEVSLRLGRAYYDIVLPYVKMGWNSTKFKYNAAAPLTLFPFASTKRHKFQNGLLLGAGVEVAVTPCVTLGGEYTANIFQKFTAFRFDNAGNVSKYSIRPFVNTVTARVTYKM